MRLVLSFVIGFAFAAPTLAEPVAQFGFGIGLRACVGSPFDVSLSPGASIRVNLAMTGVNVPTRGYRASFELLPQDGLAFPDAWRFDADGCQASAWRGTDYLPPPVETGCRSLAWQAIIGSAVTTCAFDPETRKLRIDLAVEFTSAAAPDPRLAYLVGSVPFDHFASVVGTAGAPESCGGLERAVCIHLLTLAIEDGDGNWIEAARPTSVLTVNAATLGGPAACAAVPARAATWGAVRVLYR